MATQMLIRATTAKPGGASSVRTDKCWHGKRGLSMLHRRWRLALSVVLLVMPLSHVAAEATSSASGPDSITVSDAPHVLIESITNEVVALIARYRESESQVSGQTDPQTAEDERFKQFVGDVDAAMMRAIDFDWIAFNVMGPYRKTASEAQRQEFARIFKNGLVETYGRGLLNYGDEEIVLVSPVEDLTGKRRTKVTQEIRNAEGHYPLEYSMGLNKEGEWKVLNVVINGINLGKTFRNQFVQSAQQHDGDLDRVIADWDVGGSET